MSKVEWIEKAKTELIRLHDQMDIACERPISWTEEELRHMQEWAESLASEESPYSTDDYTPEEAVREDLSYC